MGRLGVPKHLLGYWTGCMAWKVFRDSDQPTGNSSELFFISGGCHEQQEKLPKKKTVVRTHLWVLSRGGGKIKLREKFSGGKAQRLINAVNPSCCTPLPVHPPFYVTRESTRRSLALRNNIARPLDGWKWGERWWLRRGSARVEWTDDRRVTARRVE